LSASIISLTDTVLELSTLSLQRNTFQLLTAAAELENPPYEAMENFVNVC
jgi:hypothetical protein